jgi:hypothetical protein
MRNINVRGLLSAVCVISILAGFSKVSAGPVQFGEVIQLVDAKPGKADTTMFTRLSVNDQYSYLSDDDDDKKKPQQDGRVITETRTDIVQDDVCDCEEDFVKKRGFPKWWLLGLAAIPIAFIIIKRKKDTPTPTATVPNMTPTPPTTPTPGMTPTPTPHMTPTPGMTPTPNVTPTPMVTPTPPEPVPEPMTILLFGTGLASIGLAARRKYGKKGEREDEKDTE